MHIGLAVGRIHDIPRGAPEVVEQIRRAEIDGFASVWMSHMLMLEGYDGRTILAAAAPRTEYIELATFVPFLTVHPALLAHQALTLQALSNDRFLLCLASNHRVFVEQALGLEYGDPVARLGDYLPILNALMRGEPVRRLASPYRTRVVPEVSGASPPPVMIAALKRSMVQFAGRHAAGVVTIMAGPRFLEQDVVPIVGQAAHEAGRPVPRVAAHFWVSITRETEAARRCANEVMADLNAHNVYSKVLSADGVDAVGDISIIGEGGAVMDGLEALSRIGVTDLVASIPDLKEDVRAYQRTYRFLAELEASKKLALDRADA